MRMLKSNGLMLITLCSWISVFGLTQGAEAKDKDNKDKEKKMADRCIISQAPGASNTAECDRWYVLKEKEAPEACVQGEECGRWYSAEAIQVVVLRNAPFEFDESKIRPSAKPILKRYVELLRDQPNMKVQVIGHTDAVGPADYNQRLSEERARATKKFLVQQGIPPRRIVIAGRGEAHPLADNRSAKGRTQNRRVEIQLAASRYHYGQNLEIRRSP